MHASIATKLPEIYALSAQRNEESRAKLAQMIVDVFLTNTQLNPVEQNLVNGIMDELTGNASPLVKQMLANKLASATHAPHHVVFNLACDADISVAGAVLSKSDQLKDEELIYIVEGKSIAHSLAIAARQAISEAVVDALVVTGDIEIMTAVAANFGAVISQNAMHKLVEAARFAKSLHVPLVNRPELSLEAGEKLLWWLDETLRRATVKKLGMNHAQIDAALEKTIHTILDNVGADSHDGAALQNVVAWLDARNAITPRVMIQCLRMSLFELFNHMLGYKLKLDVDLVNMMVQQDGGRSVSVLCRAVGADKASFVSLFLLSRGARRGEQVVNPRELSNAMAAFDKITVETANTIIDQWREDPSHIVARLNQSAAQF